MLTTSHQKFVKIDANKMSKYYHKEYRLNSIYSFNFDKRMEKAIMKLAEAMKKTILYMAGVSQNCALPQSKFPFYPYSFLRS